ncbi:hypothetical protein A2U01_0107894, partial [Trifolium medium]|nr:hypothetical protein [Trifolium medium]
MITAADVYVGHPYVLT